LPLTGLDVYKLLPKKNCAKCGPPTCLAFAMQVASGKAAAETCPLLSDEAREKLMAMQEPPMREVRLGTAERQISLGGESVLFRHEKKFISQSAIFLNAMSGAGDRSALDIIRLAAKMRFERVGQSYSVEGVAIRAADPAFSQAMALCKELYLVPLIFTEDPLWLTAIAGTAKEARALVGMARKDTLEAFSRFSKETGCPVVLSGSGESVALAAESLFELAEEATRAGFRNIVLDAGRGNHQDTLFTLAQIRRLALKRGRRSLGYPSMVTLMGDAATQVMDASVFMSRYASVIVMDPPPEESMMSLLTWRHDLFSDPERPVQVESKLYEIQKPGPDSPLFLTTNFSLTYYSVENEVTAARAPAYILPVDTDGQSVLTAWAAGKLTVDDVVRDLGKSGANERLQRKLLVLPGYVGQMASKLRDATGYRVIVGPQEASGIPAFTRNVLSRE
jgi:acetyl-CoA decarbonylase/synthase, CODH/ACS complex subunit gamma